jgi:hypothetical protein
MTTVYHGYFTNTTNSGFLYPYTNPTYGSYISSPSGVYTAFLTPDVQFQVWRGSTPQGTPNNSVWETPPLNQGTPPGTVAVLFETGEFDLYGTNSNAVAYNVSPRSGDRSGATLSLSDSGTLTINQGIYPGPLGAQYFSNNISDPVTAITLSSINYDLSHPTITTTNQVSGGTFTQTNNTGTTQVYPVTLGLTYTKTDSWSWSLSESLSIGVKSTTSVGVPGVGSESVEFSITETTTLTGGQGGSDSDIRGFSSGGNITVPAFSTYATTLTGTTYTYDIPYTWTGVATYSTGYTAHVDGTGAFSGTDTGLFTTVTNCISTPGGCHTPPGGPGPLPVPEPSGLSLLPAALIATAVIRRLRTRSGSRAGPGGMRLRGVLGWGGPAG